ncbi:MAG: hypothetical protein CME59_02025 [Halioglobus sp.]|nr:hypothetical protein [Halioglobus sp.]
MDDSREIENLIYLYAERIDAGDLAGVAELFRDGEIVSSEYDTRHAGYEEVLGLYRQSTRIYPDSGTPKTRHLTSNVIIELDEDGADARARSCYTVLQATADLPLQPIICGRYEDRFRKTRGSWQFARREMFVDLLGDLSAHLLFNLADRST